MAERNPDAAQYEDQDGAPNRARTEEVSAREAAERLEEIQQYLLDRQSRLEVVATTTTPSGVELDWIPVESQLADGRVATPPKQYPRAERARGERVAKQARFELEEEGAERGPAGTVPVVRTPLGAIRPSVRLNDWLAKGPRANLILPPDRPESSESPGAGATHKYAFTGQSVTCYGTEGNINLWQPFVEYSDEFSLGQLSLSRGAVAGNQRQTLEVGTQTCKDIYGDWVPHLFVFYTTNNYTKQGDNLGGYNQLVHGWVQVSSTIHPAARWANLSIFDGDQWEARLKVQLWQGNWWVRVTDEWIGYYPSSLYNDAGLRSQASEVHWFGEVVDSDADPATTRTDMGSGHWPYEGWRRCAYMNHLLYQSTPDGALSRYAGTPWASHPKCYNLETHFVNDANWGDYFWWGGSGRNSQCP